MCFAHCSLFFYPYISMSKFVFNIILTKVAFRLPGIVFRWIAKPLYQILGFTISHTSFHYPLNYVIIFAIDQSASRYLHQFTVIKSPIFKSFLSLARLSTRFYMRSRMNNPCTTIFTNKSISISRRVRMHTRCRLIHYLTIADKLASYLKILSRVFEHPIFSV